MEVTEAPSVHRATELVCQFYQQFIYKAFIPKQLSRICTLHLRRSLCRRHLRDIAFTSVPSVTPCAYYIRVLVYHSIFRKNLLFVVPLIEKKRPLFKEIIAKAIKLPILLSPSDIENPFILIPQLHRQEFEKLLHNFKQDIYK